MPAALAELMDHCGRDVALALVDQFGGVRIWVPRSLRPGHPLTAIGEDFAARLVAAFGGSEVSVPRDVWTPAGRRKMISRLRQEGWSHRDIALSLGCSDRVVRDALAGRKVDKDAALAAPGPRRGDARQIDIEDFLKTRTGN